MQLRVARLCLDCEELYVGDACPVCASDRFAFLSTWLPSEERRRWRRPAPRAAHAEERHLQKFKRLLARWFGADVTESATGAVRTRASDDMPRLDFGEPEDTPPKPAGRATHPVKHNG